MFYGGCILVGLLASELQASPLSSLNINTDPLAWINSVPVVFYHLCGALGAYVVLKRSAVFPNRLDAGAVLSGLAAGYSWKTFLSSLSAHPSSD